MRALPTLAKSYTDAAVLLLNTVVLLVVVNALLGAVMLVRNRQVGLNPSSGAYPEADLRQVYGAMSDAERHRLLDEIWNRPLAYEQFVQLAEKPFVGRYVNVSEHGFRHTPPQGPWPPDPANYNVFVFGGSTTFGYGVADDQSIPALLQRALNEARDGGRRVSVYNLGRAFFYSTPERILFEQLLQAGHRPDEVVFIDGMNDFYQSDNILEYTAELSQFMASNSSQSPLGANIVRLLQSLPMGRAVTFVAGRASTPAQHGVDATSLRLAIERYLWNKSAAEVLAGHFGIRPTFVFQPVPMYHYDGRYHLFANKEPSKHGNAAAGYPMMAEYIASHAMGDNFLWLADMQQDLRRPLYCDAVHYTAEFSREIAVEIAQFLESRRTRTSAVARRQG